MKTEKIQKVLIANRGEIVVRIAATLRAMGIRSVAIYSEADRGARHVQACDEAYAIGPAAARESYLVIDKVLEVARISGADAIHPGYGFLSENIAFAEQVIAAGLHWIGPPPEAIEKMGSKIAARETMAAAGVPIVPGINHAEGGLEGLAEAAAKIGFPVLVKPAEGGGGKGMHAVYDEASLLPTLISAQREALASFGDGTLYVEKLLVKPRHIEVQIFGDQHGQVIALGERECSIQRRHQKVVEEALSPGLSPELRAEIGAAAIAAGQAVGYVGAGTVEMMLDASGHFYFLEMNTRLQVEHPVTEKVTGMDLVRWQIKVAEGAALPPAPEPRGWSIEVRLYAEDPYQGFIPQTGTVTRFYLPPMPGIRLDTGFQEGDEVTVHYDPMLAKLIAWGEDREHARRRLLGALEAWEIHGVMTNLEFLKEVIAHPAYIEGATHTGFIDEYWPEGPEAAAPDEAHLVALALAEVMGLGRSQAAAGQSDTREDAVATWHAIGSLDGGMR